MGGMQGLMLELGLHNRDLMRGGKKRHLARSTCSIEIYPFTDQHNRYFL